MFINIGSSSTNVFITEFTNDSMKVIKSVENKNVGGKNFDYSLYNFIKDIINKKYDIRIDKNTKKNFH